MNIYFDSFDEFIVSLQEHIKNNPITDLLPDDRIIIPSPMKGQPAWNRGLSLSEDHRKKISAGLKGRIQPETQRISARKSMSEMIKIEKTCEKCGKTTSLGNYKRWHGDNCGVKLFHTEETKLKIAKTTKSKYVMTEKRRMAIIESNKKRKGKKYPNGYNKSTSS